MLSQKRFFLIVLLVGALILTACGSKDDSAPQAPTVEPVAAGQVIAEGHIVPARDALLSFAASGRVDEILVSEGDTVRQGDVLARLGDRQQAEAALQAAQAELLNAQQAYDAFMRTADLGKAQAWQDYMQAQTARAQAQAVWDALDRDALQDDIEDAQAELRARQQDLEDAQDEFDKYKDLSEDNASRKQAKEALDKAQTDYDEAVAALEAAQHALDGPRAALDAALAVEKEAKRVYEDYQTNGADSETKALLQARLDAAKAQVAAAEHALAQYDLTAPFDGLVTRINLTEGQLSGPGTWALQIADISAWYVETSDLTELEVVDIQPGQSVTIVPDALPDLTLSGQVESIAPTFTSKGGDILYTVKIRLQDFDPQLRWGMTVEARFQQP